MAGQVKGITIEFRGETTSLDKALKKVNDETKSIDKELKQVNKDLKFNPKNIELWRQKQVLLRDKIGETEDKLKLLKQQQEHMDASGVDKNSEQYRKLRVQIIETESKLKHFKAQAKNLNYPGLNAMSEKLKEVGGKLKTLGDNMKKAGKTLSTYVTGPLAAIGGAGVVKFAEVDKIMTLTNKTMGNTAEEATLLDTAMKEAAANSTYGMNDAATATLNFARAGLNAEQAASALAPAMNLAAGEGGELDTVSAGLVATINGFQDSFDNASTYADVFTNACNNSALDVNGLSDAMSIAAPIFNAAGYSVKDAALYMGVMANNGIDANTAATSLKTGLARLVDPSDKGAAALEELGISVTNADGSMKDSVTIQKELNKAFSKLSESEQLAAASAIFGKNQMAPWLALINTSPESVGQLSDSLGVLGTTGEMADAMMGGFGGSIEKLKSGIDVLLTSLGQALAPILQTIINYIQQFVDWFNTLDPEMQTTIATIGAIVAAVGPLLVILGTLASSIGSIMTLVGTIGPAIGGALAAAGPVIAVIAGIIAVGVLLYKNWDTIKAKAQELWTALKAKFEAIKTSIVTTWDNIKTSAVNTFNAIKTAITHPIETAMNIIKNIVKKIKSFFDFKVKLPHIDLPYFTIDPPGWKLGDLLKGKIPKLGIGWHAEGGIFTRPTLLASANGGLHGVGEAGAEAILPLNKLWEKLDNIAYGNGVTINVYGGATSDPQSIALEVERRLVKLQKQRSQAWT